MGALALRDFSWTQFRVLFRAIRRGEKSEDVTGMGLSDNGSASKLGETGRRAVELLALVFVAALFGAMGWLFGVMGITPAAAFSLCIVLTIGMSVLFGLYQAVNVLYFVRDLSYYLSLPLSASVVMWAKLAHFLVGTIISDLAVLPMGLGCLAGLGIADPVPYVLMVVAFLPCVVTVNLALAIVVIPLMRFSRFARNKDKFSRVFGALIMVFAIAVGVGSQFLMRSEMLQGVATAAVGFASAGPVAVVMALLCPPSLAAPLVFSGDAVQVILGLVAMLALTALYVVALQACASRWYFDGVQSLQGAGAGKSARRLSGAELRRVSGVRSIFAACASRDWATVVRVPAFFNQFVLGSVLMPVYMLVIMGIATFTQMDDIDLGGLMSMVTQYTSGIGFGDEILVGCTLGVLAFTWFMGFMAYTYTLAVSRDGDDFFFLRALPMDWKAYLLSKYATTAAVSAVPTLLMLVVICAVLQMPPAVFAYLVLIHVLATGALGLCSLALGVYFPKLNWDNEAQLFKGGSSTAMVFAGMLVAVVVLAVPVLVIGAPYFWGAPAAGSLIAGLVIEAVECAAAAWWVFGPAARRLSRLER